LLNVKDIFYIYYWLYCKECY